MRKELIECKFCGEFIRFLLDDDGDWVAVEADSADSGDKIFDPAAGHQHHNCDGSSFDPLDPSEY